MGPRHENTRITYSGLGQNSCASFRAVQPAPFAFNTPRTSRRPCAATVLPSEPHTWSLWTANNVSADWSWRALPRCDPCGQTQARSNEQATQGFVIVSYLLDPFMWALNAPLQFRNFENGSPRRSLLSRKPSPCARSSFTFVENASERPHL